MLEDFSSFSIILLMIVIVLIAIFVTLIAILVHSGIFQNIEEVGTGKPPIGQTIIAYKFQKGPYSGSGQVFTEAAILSPKNRALGIYYDDPQKVESNELRYAVGSILSQGSSKVDENEVKEFSKNGFKILHLPQVDYAVRTKFPYATSLSILFGISKAYPHLRSYIEEHKLCAYPFLEYYDDEYIHFMAPLSKQEQFFVPECDMKSFNEQDFQTTINDSSIAEDESMEREVSQLTESQLNSTQNTSFLEESSSDTEMSEVCLETEREVDKKDDLDYSEKDHNVSEVPSLFELIQSNQSDA